MSHDFETCAWAKHSMKISGMYECGPLRLKLLPADKGTGICPCRRYIKRAAVPAEGLKASKKGRKTPPTLIGEPEKEKKIV
jgi:hypothetical protein